MGKKIILAGTVLFLLFEVLYFTSNASIAKYSSQKEKDNVYTISMIEGKEQFLKDYQDIVLEEKEDVIVVLANSHQMQEINQKYNITIEK